MLIILFPIAILATFSVLAWLYIALHPARAWDFQPVGDDEPVPAFPENSRRDAGAPNSAVLAAAILVPARNEADSLPKTLPALLNQDYPGAYHVYVIDDRSSDETAGLARKIAAELNQSERLTVLQGSALPEGWTGKVWALDQGVKAALTKNQPAFFMLTDADILHAPQSLRRLVSESTNAGLGLNSRMARLRCVSPAERLLIPAFVFFFNLLYPMRRANNPRDPLAAAAGGCVLLSREAVDKLECGFASIKSEIIDDVNLARQVKARGLPIRLSLSRSEVQSLREYPELGDIWKMVRRTAFTELKYSWLRLAGSLLGLFVMFVVPILAVWSGIMGIILGTNELEKILGLTVMIKGLLAFILIRYLFAPAMRFFKLPPAFALSLPIAGILYGLMTLDSALRHARGQGVQWREPVREHVMRDA